MEGGVVGSADRNPTLYFWSVDLGFQRPFTELLRGYCHLFWFR